MVLVYFSLFWYVVERKFWQSWCEREFASGKKQYSEYFRWVHWPWARLFSSNKILAWNLTSFSGDDVMTTRFADLGKYSAKITARNIAFKKKVKLLKSIKKWIFCQNFLQFFGGNIYKTIVLTLALADANTMDTLSRVDNLSSSHIITVIPHVWPEQGFSKDTKMFQKSPKMYVIVYLFQNY
jgi:hypothetical protein